MDVLAKICSSKVQPGTVESVLTAEELSNLREFIPDAGYVFVPARFGLTNTQGTIVGKATFRLYELSGGTLILNDVVTCTIGSDGSLRSGGLLSKLAWGGDADPATSYNARYCVALVAVDSREFLQQSFLDRISGNTSASAGEEGSATSHRIGS